MATMLSRRIGRGLRRADPLGLVNVTGDRAATGGRVRTPLNVYVRDPVAAANLSPSAVRLLFREAIYRIRKLEGREGGVRQAERPTWVTDSLPDSDVTVLMRLADPEQPVWVGFHDGESWRSSDASTVKGPVLGWIHLEDAVKAI